MYIYIYDIHTYIQIYFFTYGYNSLIIHNHFSPMKVIILVDEFDQLTILGAHDYCLFSLLKLY